MSGANTIGTGAVVLTANADQLIAGLDRARQKTDDWARKTSKGVKGGFDKQKGNDLAELTGLNKLDVIKGGLKLGMWGVAAAGVLSFGKHLNETIGPMKSINAEIERSTKLHEKLVEKLNDTADGFREVADAAIERGDIAAAKGGEAGIQNSIESAEQNLKKLKAQLADKKSWGSWDSWSNWTFGGLEDQKKALEKQVADTEATIKGLQDKKKGVAKALEELGNPENSVKAKARLDDFLSRMKDMEAAARGVASEWSEIDKLERERKVSKGQADQMREAFRRMQQIKNEAEQFQEEVKKAGEINKPALAGAFAQGSTDAYSILTKHQMSLTAGAKNQELKVAKESNNELKQIKMAIRGMADGWAGSLLRVID